MQTGSTQLRIMSGGPDPYRTQSVAPPLKRTSSPKDRAWILHALAVATTHFSPARAREGQSSAAQAAATDYVSMYPLNPRNARRARFERIAEVLGFADHLPAPELHNAHRARRLPVVGEDAFSDPEVGSAEYPPHRE
jgi:hypothetical protein